MNELENTSQERWTEESYEIATKIAYENAGMRGTPRGAARDCGDVRDANVISGGFLYGRSSSESGGFTCQRTDSQIYYANFFEGALNIEISDLHRYFGRLWVDPDPYFSSMREIKESPPWQSAATGLRHETAQCK